MFGKLVLLHYEKMSENKRDFIRTINDTDFTQTVRYTYLKLIDKYRNVARITDIFTLLRESLDIPEWILLDTREVQNGNFESYLIEKQQSWLRNEPINFTELYKALLTTGEFVISERRMFEQGNIEEILWAIFLVITKPDLEITY